MSGNLINGAITNGGDTAIVNNNGTSSGIEIAYAEVGSTNIYTYTTAQLQALTAVSGLVYNTTSNSNALVYSVNTGSPNQVLYKVLLDETVGNFSVGNIGLFTSNNVLFAIGALQNTDTKVATTGGVIGNRKTYNLFVEFSNAATIVSFSILTQDAASIPEVATQNNLPAASSAPFDLYLVDNYTEYGAPALAARYGGTWYYLLMQEPNPQVGGAIWLPGAFNSNINPGDAVYFNGTQFELASSSNSYQNYPIGIRGFGDYLYPSGSVFTQFVATYTQGSKYYCSDTGLTGNVVASNSSNFAMVGYGLSATQFLVSIPPINQTIYGSLEVLDSSGNISLLIPGAAGNPIQLPKGIVSGPSTFTGTTVTEGNIQSTGKFLAAEGTGTNGGYSFTNDINQDTGMFSPSDGILALYSNGIQNMSMFDSIITFLNAVSGPAAISSGQFINLGQGDGRYLLDSNWQYAGQSGQPTWLWGTNNGGTQYVWNPSNFNVNYANSSGSSNTSNYANTVGGTSFPGNLARTGSQKLPNGFIIQWGDVGVGPSGNTFMTFPLTFPNQCFTVIVTEGNANAGTWGVGNITVHGVSNISNNGYTGWARVWGGNSFSTGNLAQNYMAVGY
jgi:hypothetical protein